MSEESPYNEVLSIQLSWLVRDGKAQSEAHVSVLLPDGATHSEHAYDLGDADQAVMRLMGLVLKAVQYGRE